MPADVQSRKDFEAFYTGKYPQSYMGRNAHGIYMSASVQHAWTVWQEAQRVMTIRLAEFDAAMINRSSVGQPERPI